MRYGVRLICVIGGIIHCQACSQLRMVMHCMSIDTVHSSVSKPSHAWPAILGQPFTFPLCIHVRIEGWGE